MLLENEQGEGGRVGVVRAARSLLQVPRNGLGHLSSWTEGALRAESQPFLGLRKVDQPPSPSQELWVLETALGSAALCFLLANRWAGPWELSKV